MILTAAEMNALEESAFADGISADSLMEEAGERIADAVRQFFPEPGKCVVHLGKGHNGGDALVAARHLVRSGWCIDLQAAFPESSWADLTSAQFRRFKEAQVRSSDRQCPLARHLVILDGLLGIGAGGLLREPIRAATQAINQTRAEKNAHVFALDLPTGLDGDSGATDPDAVIADFTLTIGFAKKGLLADQAINHVGRLAILPLAELSKRAKGSSDSVATSFNLSSLLPRRRFDTHKGDCGRIGIIAGSLGLAGAAIMTAEAALHAGAGLVTLYVRPEIYTAVVGRIAPEIMVRPVDSYLEVTRAKHDVLAVGPGIGDERADEVLELFRDAPQPMVVDADALNILSRNLDALTVSRGERVLTPHPGEMARLDPESKTRSRRCTVERFVERWPFTLLFKGARTIVGKRGFPLSYNSTGNPGMATGGMGDALTGVIAGLAGQGLTLYDAARLGAWTCGRAAELSLVRGGKSEESLSATHVIENLGLAFQALRSHES